MPPSNPDDAAWIEGATQVHDFTVDSLFLIAPHIQFCDEQTGRIIPGEAEHLPIPDLPFIQPEWVTASSLHGQEDELIRHYKRIFAAFAQHGRSAQLRPRSNQFWLKPAIVENGAILTRCSWYDTVPEAEALLQALIGAAHAPDGEVWDDLDQGWAIRIVKSGGMTCLAEWNWEDGETAPAGYVFNAAKMAQRATVALTELRALHETLVETFGCDWWS